MTAGDAFFSGDVLGEDVLARVRAALSGFDDLVERTTKSQVGFRRRRGFAYLWRPDMYLGARARGIVVISFVLDQPIQSERFKEVNKVGGRRWMHHLEVRDAEAIDAEVVAWLEHAAREAT